MEKLLKTMKPSLLMCLIACSPAATIFLIACGPSGLQKSKDNKTALAPAVKGHITMMEPSYKTKFEDLPLEGAVEPSKRLWSGDFWPMNKGNINRRWNISEDGFNSISPTKEELLLLTNEEVSRLAPSEKYDLLMGQYNYPLKKEVESRANPMAVNWEGIGNGWAAASINHDEPTPKVLMNPDGIAIPFGSHDIKALLSYYYSFSQNLPLPQQLGLRCMKNSDEASTIFECNDDLSAASFHVTLTNRIGLMKKSFSVDIDRYQEVWNHPFQRYSIEVIETTLPTAEAPAGSVITYQLKTKVYYVDRPIGNSWDPIIGSTRQVITNRIYRYDLHLDSKGEIISGVWKTNDRPDFMWVMAPVTNFEGYFSGLGQLL